MCVLLPYMTVYLIECAYVCSLALRDCVFDRVCEYLHISIRIYVLRTHTSDEIEMNRVAPIRFFLEHFHLNFS